MNPSPSLSDLQRGFADELHYRPAALPVQDGVADADGLLQIYRNNFVITLTECLELAYPACQKLVGEEFFEAVARRHILSYPLSTASVSDYGEGFADTLAGLEAVTSNTPYLPDLARVEWMVYRLSQFPWAANEFPFDLLQQVPPEQMGDLHLVPSGLVGLVSAEYAVGDLWQWLQHGEGDPPALSPGQHLAVIRREDGIGFATLTGTEAQLLAACYQNLTLGEIPQDWLSALGPLVEKQLLCSFRLDAE
ncbi:DNA-binding domain-containing protein [Parasalinivibrio latis]|uniref:HvfC/BufC family peptide modification chaperone n=1 Tax=Parasalinivibrio latis TaxID=2952610 RepID=UPI0030E562A4